MAAGTYRSWNRHSVKIFGETTIERTIRLLKKHHINDIWITSSKKGTYNFENEYVNSIDGNSLGCLIGCKDLDGDIYLFGDVYYTENAINLIINNNTNYFGRNSKNNVKPYGEFFGFKPDNDFWKMLEICWHKFQNNEIPRLWSWDLYAYHTNKWDINNPPDRKTLKKTQYLTPTNWTNINDQTDDFDTPNDLIKWTEHWYETKKN